MLYYNNSDGHNNFLHPGKMCIRDFTTFPSKPYLISRFDWFLKYYYEEGYRATIYDQEDKEISIEELIDRYYQKPEITLLLRGQLIRQIILVAIKVKIFILRQKVYRIIIYLKLQKTGSLAAKV